MMIDVRSIFQSRNVVRSTALHYEVAVAGSYQRAAVCSSITIFCFLHGNSAVLIQVSCKGARK